MRNLQLEAAIWHLFTSIEFFEAAAYECEEIMDWFGTLAISRNVANFGRNNQIFDKFKKLAGDFRRGAEMAKLGDYKLIWTTARSVRGDVRGMLEQPLHSWMTKSEYEEFESVRINCLMKYAGRIDSALNNALVGAESFYKPDPNFPERSNDDDGYPGDEIVEWYEDYIGFSKKRVVCAVPDPLLEYVADMKICCRTGNEVPWTGIWYPDTGLERHSLTFAIKGLKMQPAFRVIKTKEELTADGILMPYAKTVAVETTWHPLIPSDRFIDTELRAKAGEPCPKAGIWQPMDSGAAQRSYEAGETMGNLGSAYGITVWRWMAER